MINPNVIHDLPAKRAKNVKVEPIAGLSDEVQKIKDAFKMYKALKKVDKMFDQQQKQKKK